MQTPDEDAMRALTRELELLNSHRFIRIHNSPWRLLMFQLLRGLAMGLGTVMGATVLVSCSPGGRASFPSSRSSVSG